jgi:hypothetical protein
VKNWCRSNSQKHNATRFWYTNECVCTESDDVTRNNNENIILGNNKNFSFATKKSIVALSHFLTLISDLKSEFS